MRRKASSAAVFGAAVIGLGACGSGSRFSVDRPAKATNESGISQHPLTATPGGVVIPAGGVPHVAMQAAPSASTRSTAASPAAAVDQFLKAVQADQPEVAYRLLTTADQHTFATAAAFAGVLANEPLLTGFRVSTTAPLSAWSDQNPAPPAGVKHRVTAELEFTPAVDSIVGVVAPTATATFDTVSETDGWRVAWTKRRIEPAYAAESRVIDDITTWAKSRQSCSGALNESPELTGVVGLASALCNTKTPLKLDPVVSGFDNVDDPQPVLDTFGGQAPNWARVVTVESPIKMRVVAAPLGDHWIAVAVDRVSPT